KVGKQPTVTTTIAPGPDGEVQSQAAPAAPAELLPIKDITTINYPPLGWKGALALNGLFTTGNSETEQVGFTGDLLRRWEEDRLAFHAEYSYGRQTDPNTGISSTSVNYGQFSVKYEHDLTEKLYAYGLFKVERDEVAGLNVRLGPSAGLGYRWFE